MGVFVEGMFADLVALLLVCALVFVFIFRARGGMKVPTIRKINGLEAIDESIGRATEMGRPVHITSGLSSITDPEAFAFMATLGHVAKQCAKYDTRLIQTNCDYALYAVNEEIVRQAYLEAGRPDSFNRDDVRFIADWQFAYAAGVLGIFQREKVAANIMMGVFYAEALIFAEAGYQAGAIQIAGTTSTAQIPFFVAACDYCLIGEEIYAASAYLSKDPILVGSVIGQDWTRITIWCLIVIGTLIANFAKSNPLFDFLKNK